MDTLIVKGLPEDLHGRLIDQAMLNGRSVDKEVSFILALRFQMLPWDDLPPPRAPLPLPTRELRARIKREAMERSGKGVLVAGGVPDALLQRLKAEAVMNGRSVDQEMASILSNHLRPIITDDLPPPAKVFPPPTNRLLSRIKREGRLESPPNRYRNPRWWWLLVRIRARWGAFKHALQLRLSALWRR